MPLAVDDILRVTACFLDANGSQIQNTFHYKVINAPPATDADAVTTVTSEILQVYATIDQKMPTDLTTNFILIDHVAWYVDHWEVQYTLAKTTWPGGLVFAAADDKLAPQNAALVTLQTQLRKHSGRKYFGPFTEVSNGAGGNLVPGLVTDLAGTHTALLNAMNFPSGGGSIQIVIPNMSGPATNPVIACVTNNIWRSQRRRQPGVGI